MSLFQGNRIHVATVRIVGMVTVVVAFATQALRANDRLISAAERTRRSIVGIEVELNGRKERGSGFVVDKNGLIATNYHIIAGAISCEVTLPDGERMPMSSCLAADPTTDVALISVEKSEVPALKLIDVAVPPGEEVIAFGSPAMSGFRVSLKKIDREVTTEHLRSEFKEIATQRPFVRHFDKDATWLQTASPLSSRSCGTPLVTADGAVAGMNTWWIDSNGQRTTFAVPAASLRQLLTRAGSTATISTATLSPFEKPRSAQLKATAFVLPEGRALDMADFAIRDVGFDRDRELIISYPNGKPAARFERTGDMLDGNLATLYENGNIMWTCRYTKNDRDGRLTLMAEDGKELLLASTFRKSRSDGATVLFSEGEPWLVRESKVGTVKKYHLFENMVLARSFEPKSRETALRFALIQLDALEVSIKEQEVGIRRWTRGVDEDERWQRAAANANENRQRSAARRRQRAEEGAAVIQELQRRSYARP